MSLKIHYIDDDKFMRIFFENYFESKFDIRTSDSAEEAWKLYQAGYTPDLIVLDLGLPGQDGKSFLKELKIQYKLMNVPVVVLSGNDKSHTRIEMLKAGVDDFIVKPFNPEELELKIIKYSSLNEKKLNPRYSNKANGVSGTKLNEG